MRPACALGFEPPMFRGLTGTELTAVIFLSLVPGLLFAGVVVLWTGSLLWVLPVLVAAAFLMVLCAGTMLRRLKRNRPPNWHLQYFARHWGRHLNLVRPRKIWRVER